MKIHTLLTTIGLSFKKIFGLVTLLLFVFHIFGMDVPSSLVSNNESKSIVATLNNSADYLNSVSNPGLPAPNPVDATVCVGGTATFTVSGYTTYQWESSPDGFTWTSMSGKTSPTLTLSLIHI